MARSESGFMKVPASGTETAPTEGGIRKPMEWKPLVLASLASVPGMLLGIAAVSATGLAGTPVGWFLLYLPGGVIFGTAMARMTRPPGTRLAYLIGFMSVWTAVNAVVSLLLGGSSLG